MPIKPGKLMRQWREYKGLTMREVSRMVARRTGDTVTAKTISDWENTDVQPKLAKLTSVSEALGLTYEEFMAGPDMAGKVFIPSTQETEGLVEIYSLAGIQAKLESSRFIGYSSPLLSPRLDVKTYIVVYVDLTEALFPFGSKIVVLIKEPPRKGDTLLIWDTNRGPEFRVWDGSPIKLAIIHGVVARS